MVVRSSNSAPIACRPIRSWAFRMRYTLDSGRREGLTSPSIYATLPGSTDETIYVMAHMDGYYDAARDNASGMAVMIGLAERPAR